jgi:hypothetical protein
MNKFKIVFLAIMAAAFSKTPMFDYKLSPEFPMSGEEFYSLKAELEAWGFEQVELDLTVSVIRIGFNPYSVLDVANVGNMISD